MLRQIWYSSAILNERSRLKSFDKVDETGREDWRKNIGTAKALIFSQF